jgi:hypothetical protein
VTLFIMSFRRLLPAFAVLAATVLCGAVPAVAGDAGDRGAAQSVLDRYVEAIGGSAAIDAIHSRVTVYDMTLGLRISGSLEIRQQLPDRVIERGTARGWGWRGEFTKGFDGTDGWIKGPDEKLPHRLEGSELQSYILKSRLDRDAHLQELYPTRIARPDRAIKDKLYHVVEMTTRFGAREIWYFDGSTGLLAQTEVQDTTTTVTTTTFDDYRWVDGVRIPFRMTVQGGKQRYALAVRTVRNNVPLESIDSAIPK